MACRMRVITPGGASLRSPSCAHAPSRHAQCGVVFAAETDYSLAKQLKDELTATPDGSGLSLEFRAASWARASW